MSTKEDKWGIKGAMDINEENGKKLKLSKKEWDGLGPQEKKVCLRADNSKREH